MMILLPLFFVATRTMTARGIAVQGIGYYPTAFGYAPNLAGTKIAIVSLIPTTEQIAPTAVKNPTWEDVSNIYTFKIVNGLGLAPGTEIRAIQPYSPLGKKSGTNEALSFRILPPNDAESPTATATNFVVVLDSVRNADLKKVAPYRLLLISSVKSTVLPKGTPYGRLVKILAANSGAKSPDWMDSSYCQLITAVESAPVPTPKSPSIAEENLKLGKLIEKDALALQGGRRVGMDFLASLMGEPDSTATAFTYLLSGASKTKEFRWLDVTDAIDSWFPAGTSQAYVTPTLKKQLLAVDDSSDMEALCLRFQKTLTNGDVDRDLKAAIARLSHGDINLQIPLFQSIYLEIWQGPSAEDFAAFGGQHGSKGPNGIQFTAGTFYLRGHQYQNSTPESVLFRGLDYLKAFQAYRQSLGH